MPPILFYPVIPDNSSAIGSFRHLSKQDDQFFINCGSKAGGGDIEIDLQNSLRPGIFLTIRRGAEKASVDKSAEEILCDGNRANAYLTVTTPAKHLSNTGGMVK